MSEKYWFVVHIDRDFVTKTYGNGPTLITNLIGNQDGIYDIKSYVKKDDGIIVKTHCGCEVELTGYANNIKFEEYYKKWEHWDQENGEFFEEDRIDFKPILYTDYINYPEKIVINTDPLPIR
jgi:hypothetical protein